MERFLDNAAEIGRSVICVGSGNEGNSAGHVAGNLFGEGNRAASGSTAGAFRGGGTAGTFGGSGAFGATASPGMTGPGGNPVGGGRVRAFLKHPIMEKLQ